MGLKILHSADWHLNTPFGGMTKRQRGILRSYQRSIPGMIAALCKEEQCDLVLLAGDLLEGEPNRELLDAMKRGMEDCGVPVLIAPGNQDYSGPASPWIKEQWPQNVYIFKGSMESVVFPELDCRVYGAGFQGPECGPLMENFRKEGEETWHIAVLHGDPTQRNSPYDPITASQVRQSELDYLALGHIHTAGALRSGKTYCAWPGSPMGRGWDETGEKGVCIVSLGEQTEIRAIPLNTPRFHDSVVDIGEDAVAALEAILPEGGSEDFFRVDLVGYGIINVESLRAKCSAWPNLKLRDSTHPPLDLWANAGCNSLEGIYFDMLRKEMEQNPDKADQVRLAAEISRRLLMGEEVAL